MTAGKIIKISTPFTKEMLASLQAGDIVLLSGPILTARDAAHKRFIDLIDRGEPLPLSLEGQALYYTGPTPPVNGRPAGSAGPTTSSRMDCYTPKLLRKTGLCAMIGKGDRSVEVIEAIKECGCVYFAAIGGAGALISSYIKSSKTVCYEDLGPEAVYKFEVESMRLIVAIDTQGNNLYRSGPRDYLERVNGFL
ncbi:MAG: Fe-S-containing hydro-lyase [Chitinispirillales bacterium]|jgi:fumarate hydratase subunit beta|nr:Fe-S-containing hydro-lyase [Chitinispirillales bacterium]